MTERELSQAVHLKAEVHLGRLGSFALPFSLRKVVAKLIQLFYHIAKAIEGSQQ